MLKCELPCNFIEITLRHECSPVNLLHILRTPFFKNTSEWLLLKNIWTFLHNYDVTSLENINSIKFESIKIVVKKTTCSFPYM